MTVSILNINIDVGTALRCHDKVNDDPKLAGCGAMCVQADPSFRWHRKTRSCQELGTVKALCLQ